MSIPKSTAAAHRFVKFMNRSSLRVCTDKAITKGTMEILVNPEDEKEVRALLGPDCMRTALEELSARALSTSPRLARAVRDEARMNLAYLKSVGRRPHEESIQHDNLSSSGIDEER